MFKFKKVKTYQRRYLKYDFMAGLVVFLVAVPLCLGIALASGAPLFSGIIAGIIGGIVVGSISQSSVSVSGPAAGMTAIVLAAILHLGSFNLFLSALVLAGLVQVALGSLRAGFIADYIPSNVIQGLLCAIGILIIIKQLPFAFTYPFKNGMLLESLKTASELLSIQPLLTITQHINLGAVIISAASLLFLIYSDKTRNKKIKMIPAPVIVVLFGVIMNEIYNYGFPYLIQNHLEGELVNIPLHNGFTDFLGQLQFPDYKGFLNFDVYFYAIAIAALASVETLLNIDASEKLDERRRYCSRNRELMAQGVGNTLSGLLGGIAITSVVVRSSVNIQSGAKSKYATIFHGMMILGVIAIAPNFLNKIPLASLAAILIYVGYKLSSLSVYKKMYAQGFERFFPFIVTVFAIIFTNLLLGILIGLVTSFFFILRSNSQTRIDIIQEMHPAGPILRMMLPQQMSFLNKASLIRELNNIKKDSQLTIDASRTKYIDKDILELIKEFDQRQAPDKKITVNLVGFKETYDVRNHIDFLNVTTYEVQNALTPEKILTILQEGNERFLKDQRIHRGILDIKATSSQQYPIAAILSCIDSRVPVETVFDMGLGDLFTIRVAGNIVNEDIIASVEFACYSGAKLIVVMGHTHCGAIEAACNSMQHGHITQLLDKIKPAIEAAKGVTLTHGKESNEFIFTVTKLNVINTIQTLYHKSEFIREYVNSKKVGLIGAIYDVKTGYVRFDVLSSSLSLSTKQTEDWMMSSQQKIPAF